MHDIDTTKRDSAQAFNGSNSLADLRERLKVEHAAVTELLKTSLTHAMSAGDILIEAKTQLKKHGAWLPWLKSCGLSERTSQHYMRLARNRTIIESNTKPVSDLGIRGALAMLAVPRKSGDDLADDLADLADLSAEAAFDFWDVLGAANRSDSKRQLALHAEARAAVERIGKLMTTQELADAIDNASGGFVEQITTACGDYRMAVASEMGLSAAELDEIEADFADRKARGYGEWDLVQFYFGKWGHTLDRDSAADKGAATAVVTKVRDLAIEWERHAEKIIAEAAS